tara:strand:- start:9529 stop:10323 length:795 start_codon:yes stop_codon:yes gene_type:complete
VLTKVLVLSVIFYIGICAFMFFRQEQLLFPAHFAPKSPSENFATFKTADGTLLESKTFLSKNKKAPNLVLFAGNAQNALLAAEVIWNSFNQRLNVYTINYRSYGNSQGKPTEENIFADSLAFTHHIAENYNNNAPVYLMGISLGTGVASYVASQKKVDGLILMTPFDSIEKVAAGQYPFLPVKYLIKHRFDSAYHIQTVQAPVAIIRAGEDEVIAKSRTDALVEHIPNLAHDYTVPAMAHTEVLENRNHDLLQKVVLKAYQAIQ